ncbi:MAG: GFA family protein [Cohaesibacter sp.]|jgi:hypothetical protein|nr:GFA family protein [Cohaesibacter sp.]
MSNHKGSCLCGAIRYEVEGDLRPVMACHCTQCRKTSGHYVAATQCSTKALTIHGTVRWYHSSEQARRGFCPTCGSPLFWQPGDRSVTSIFAGSLDGDTGLRLESQIHSETKGDYYDLPAIPVCKQEPIKP